MFLLLVMCAGEANKLGIGNGNPFSQNQIDLAAGLSGDGGYLLVVCPGVTPSTGGPDPAWVDNVKWAYAHNLIPVMRLNPPWGDNDIRSKSDDSAHRNFTTYAQAYKRVVQGLPLKDGVNMYLQINNEVNLCGEWWCSGGGWLNASEAAAEYSAFYSQVAIAIHSIGDQRHKVAAAPMAPGGCISCECCGGGNCKFQGGATGLDHMNHMLAADPNVYAESDWLASHSYPAAKIGSNFFVPFADAKPGLTYYLNELSTIKRKIPVIITETGWTLHPPAGNTPVNPTPQTMASDTVSAFTEIWNPSPDVIGVTPFLLQDGNWGDKLGFGWVLTSGAVQPVYQAVQKLRCDMGIEGPGCPAN